MTQSVLDMRGVSATSLEVSRRLWSMLKLRSAGKIEVLLRALYR